MCLCVCVHVDRPAQPNLDEVSLSPRYVNPDPSGEDGVHNTDYHTSLLLSLMTAEVESLEQLRGGYLSQLGRLREGGRQGGRIGGRDGREGGRE